MAAEADMMKRLRAGDDLALQWLMERYGNDIIRTAYMLLKDRHLAEDVSQEVFLTAYHKANQFRGEGSLKGWLLQIIPESDMLEGDRLIIKGKYEEAIEAYKKEGDNDHALRVLGRLADQGITKEDGDPAEALAYLERIKEPNRSDEELIQRLREKLRR